MLRLNRKMSSHDLTQDEMNVLFPLILKFRKMLYPVKGEPIEPIVSKWDVWREIANRYNARKPDAERSPAFLRAMWLGWRRTHRRLRTIQTGFKKPNFRKRVKPLVIDSDSDSMDNELPNVSTVTDTSYGQPVENNNNNYSNNNNNNNNNEPEPMPSTSYDLHLPSTSTSIAPFTCINMNSQWEPIPSTSSDYQSQFVQRGNNNIEQDYTNSWDEHIHELCQSESSSESEIGGKKVKPEPKKVITVHQLRAAIKKIKTKKVRSNSTKPQGTCMRTAPFVRSKNKRILKYKSFEMQSDAGPSCSSVNQPEPEYGSPSPIVDPPVLTEDDSQTSLKSLNACITKLNVVKNEHRKVRIAISQIAMKILQEKLHEAKTRTGIAKLQLKREMSSLGIKGDRRKMSKPKKIVKDFSNITVDETQTNISDEDVDVESPEDYKDKEGEQSIMTEVEDRFENEEESEDVDVCNNNTLEDNQGESEKKDLEDSEMSVV